MPYYYDSHRTVRPLERRGEEIRSLGRNKRTVITIHSVVGDVSRSVGEQRTKTLLALVPGGLLSSRQVIERGKEQEQEHEHEHLSGVKD